MRTPREFSERLPTCSVPAGPSPEFQGAVDPANALAVTNVTGTFSDAALGIADATITGLVAI